MEEKQIPRSRIRQYETYDLFAMFAAAQELDRCAVELERRLHDIPGGYRDMMMIKTVLRNLCNKILFTIPDEKLDQLKRTLPHMQYKVYMNGSIGSIEKREMIIAEEDFDTLVQSAREYRCIVCDNNCGKCDLGKVFDRNFSYCRLPTESWSAIPDSDLTGDSG